MQDLRYAFRSLRKQPIFTIVAVLTLTLGIGANTAIFSLLYQTLLRPLPYPAADRLVFVWNTYRSIDLAQASVSIPDYIDRKTQALALEDAALFTGRTLTLAQEGRPEQLKGLAVATSFFSTLGRQPFLGRPFVAADAHPEADKFVVLTEALWKSRFGADSAIIGRDIRLNGESYRVLGVMPADFEIPARDISVLVPFSFTPQQMSDDARGNEFSSMIGRLRPGATLAQLNAQIATIVDRNHDRLPGRAHFELTSGFGGIAIPFRDQPVGGMKTLIVLLQEFILLVLLIACSNVAILLFMRATGRGRGLVVRSTRGAGRWRIVREML